MGALSILLSLARDRMGDLNAPLRYAGAACAVILIALWVRAAVGFQRSLDEMQRQMFLEATSFVGIAALAWVYLFPVLEKAHVVQPIDHDQYFAGVAVCAFLGWWLTARRYR
ncbi:MAG: hypothetical protein K2X35_20935 [Bryobacteraceae bacterium]|nr:hypothetical protein [Bryobacteraceae bacterium]